MRLALITDVHENQDLLARALSLAENMVCDEIACLGDITGFDPRFYHFGESRSARECVRMIASNCRYVVSGNHDLHSVMRFPSWSDGFEFPAGWFRMDPGIRRSISMGKVWSYEQDLPADLDDKSFEYLRSLPEFLPIQEDKTGILISHYLAPDFTGSLTKYIEKKSQTKAHWDHLQKLQCGVSFTGHSHRDFPAFSYNDTRWSIHAFHTMHGNRFYLGEENTIVSLPPLAAGRGRSSFAIFDSFTRDLEIINIFQ